MTSFCQQAIAYIKPSTFAAPLEPAAGQRAPSPAAPAVYDLGNGLCIAFVVDEKESFAYVQQRHLQEEQIDLNTLHHIGLNNLRQRSKGKLSVQQHGAIHRITYDGNFDASLLLLDTIWNKKLQRMTPNGCVVALPSREVLAFCDRHSEEGIDTLEEMVNRVFDGGEHLLSPSLFYRDKGHWHLLDE